MKKMNNFCECGKKIDRKATNCRECSRIKVRKVVNRPSKEQLINELTSHSYVALGKKYGVSDNTIRKWLK